MLDTTINQFIEDAFEVAVERSENHIGNQINVDYVEADICIATVTRFGNEYDTAEIFDMVGKFIDNVVEKMVDSNKT